MNRFVFPALVIVVALCTISAAPQADFSIAAVGAIVLGCALRTLLPYVLIGLKVIGKEEASWKDWPKFQPRYLSAFVLALIAYAIAVATIPGAYGALMAMGFVQAVALAYAGQDISRELIKAVFG